MGGGCGRGLVAIIYHLFSPRFKLPVPFIIVYFCIASGSVIISGCLRFLSMTKCKNTSVNTMCVYNNVEILNNTSMP